MRTTQSIGWVGGVLGVISLALGVLPGCSSSKGNWEPAAKEVTSAESHYPVKAGPPVGNVPLCGDTENAVHHYSCAKGYSSY